MPDDKKDINPIHLFAKAVLDSDQDILSRCADIDLKKDSFYTVLEKIKEVRLGNRHIVARDINGQVFGMFLLVSEVELIPLVLYALEKHKEFIDFCEREEERKFKEHRQSKKNI